MSNIKTTTETKNNWLRFAESVIWSKEFFWTSVIIMSSLALLQIILFTCNITVVNGFKISELSGATTNEQITIWLRLVISGVGGVTATLGLLLINRGDKKFYYYSITTAILLTLNGFLSNLFFEGAKWFIVGIILLINAIIWNIPSIEIKPKKTKVWISIVVIMVIILVMGLIGYFGVSEIPEESHFYNSMPVLDPTQFGLTVTGNVMMIFKIVESRIIYGVGNVFTILMFGVKTIKGDLVSLNQTVQGVLYLIVTISGFIILKDEYARNKEEINAN